MIIKGVQKELIPPIVALLNKVSGQASSIPALIGFYGKFGTTIIEPVKGIEGSCDGVISNNDVVYSDITYEALAYWLTRSTVSLCCTDFNELYKKGDWKVVEVDDVSCYALRLTSENVNSDKSNCLKIPSYEESYLVSEGLPFNISGFSGPWELSLLFAPRNQIEKLPPEFKFFRTWKEWLTLGNSVCSLGKAKFYIDELKGVGDIEFIPTYSELEESFRRDLSVVANLLAEEIK